MPEADRPSIFVSWSRSVAANIATVLKPFLQDVLGGATILMSQDMAGGTRWATEIPRWLEECNAGLVLVTRENSREPWLHFEAGALSKRIEAQVIPMLCGASIGDIEGTPLSLFQAKRLDQDDCWVCVFFWVAPSASQKTLFAADLKKIGRT